jgi:hypothetical protein
MSLRPLGAPAIRPRQRIAFCVRRTFGGMISLRVAAFVRQGIDAFLVRVMPGK